MKTEMKTAKVSFYKSDNGFWRASIDGKLHPLLVGFECLDVIIEKAQGLLPSIPMTVVRDVEGHYPFFYVSVSGMSDLGRAYFSSQEPQSTLLKVDQIVVHDNPLSVKNI